MAGIGDVVDATRSSIGRYFSLISVLPSMLLVLYLYVLIASGAWSGDPQPARVVPATADLGLGSVTLLVVASLGLGLILHPLQFAFVQILEGYWGPGAIVARIRAVRMSQQWRRLERLRLQKALAGYHLRNVDPTVMPENHALLSSRKDEADRLAANYPEEPRLVMPTRLGNVLRYYETTAGFPFGLNTIQIMPYLARVAPAEDMRYVNDQRSLLDLAARMAVTGMLATAMSALFLWQHGFWLLVALIPYAVAYLSYRGAIVAAAAYGQALTAIIALNRFTLYERLRLPLPANTWAERAANARLRRLLLETGPADEREGERPSRVWLRYQHPAAPTGNAPQQMPESGEARGPQG